MPITRHSLKKTSLYINYAGKIKSPSFFCSFHEIYTLFTQFRQFDVKFDEYMLQRRAMSFVVSLVFVVEA